MKTTCEHCNEYVDDARQRTPGDFNAPSICGDCAKWLVADIALPTACTCGACGPCRNAALLALYWGARWHSFDDEERGFALLALEETDGEPIALIDTEDAA